MQNTVEQTTMICLFHETGQAEAAVRDLVAAGVPQNTIGVMDKSANAANPAALDKWGVPERDKHTIIDGISRGGTVIALSAQGPLADKVQAIFERHQAGKIDETASAPSHKPVASTNNGGTIEVIEENLVVGKREVQRGGVRVFQRMTEKPVSETVTLRDETIHVDRHPVDRAATAADMANFKDQSFEVTETDEEAVVSKTARVVEEIHVGKETTEHQQRIQDTVRKTGVTVEELDPDGSPQGKTRRS